MRPISVRKNRSCGHNLLAISFFDESNPVKVITPHKEIKGEPENTQKDKGESRQIHFSHKAVSKVRQPIEFFFNWLNEKTEIQRASK